MKRFVQTVVVALLFAVTLFAQQVLNNDAVVKMSKAGLGDDIIVATIKSSPGTYSLSPDDLISLKKQGLSSKVISAMIEKNSAPAAPAPAAVAPAPTAPLVDEVGVYFKDKDGKWVELLPEVVNWKTGGALKRFATDGIVKGDVNGHLEGKASKSSLNTPLDFLVYMQDGVAITEYQLLHLRESGDSREFRSVTGGVVHSSSGAQRDEVDFQGTKLAPRMYEVVLGPDVKTGDYGFLPPGAMSSSNMASSGKMYTFHVIE